jgi:D-alanyl-D-alanine carboxypeptidase
VVALTAEGPMTVKLGGQQAIPVAAVSETEFRLIGVDARLAFQVEGGKVTGAVIKQRGRELPAKRMD